MIYFLRRGLGSHYFNAVHCALAYSFGRWHREELAFFGFSSFCQTFRWQGHRAARCELSRNTVSDHAALKPTRQLVAVGTLILCVLVKHPRNVRRTSGLVNICIHLYRNYKRAFFACNIMELNIKSTAAWRIPCQVFARRPTVRFVSCTTRDEVGCRAKAWSGNGCRSVPQPFHRKRKT